MSSVVDFAAQFGGRDATQVVLPHFRALKRAARDVTLSGFPFPKLAFVLRVDGEVSGFGIRGPANVDIDKYGNYVSVDIGLSRADWDLLSGDPADNPISNAIFAGVALLQDAADERFSGAAVDFAELRGALESLCSRYEAHKSDSMRI